MNILFLSCWYPSADKPHKGVFVREHARAIQAPGSEVVVLALHVLPSKGLFRYKANVEMDQNIPTHHLTIHSYFYKGIYALTPFLTWLACRYFKKNIAPTFSPDIVHSNVISPAGIMGWNLSKRLNKPHVITEHWSKTHKFFSKNIWAKQGRKAYNQAQWVSTVSSFLKQQITPFFQNPDQIRIIPNVVDQSRYVYQPKPAGNKLVFCAIATWESPKRPDLFIAALTAFVKTSKREVELHLFGEGSQLTAIKQQEHPFPIVYRGYCGKDEIATQLQKTHCFLHASAIETFSIVVAEALSTGTPVVASNVGAIPDLISNEQFGQLCENTVESWTTAIHQVAAQSFDYAAIAQAVSQKYSYATIGGLFRAGYQEIFAKA